jgi:hypothetical protein
MMPEKKSLDQRAAAAAALSSTPFGYLNARDWAAPLVVGQIVRLLAAVGLIRALLRPTITVGAILDRAKYGVVALLLRWPVGKQFRSMATNQPLSDPSALPVLEAILGTAPTVALAGAAADARNQTGDWRALEERIAAWAPADGELDVRADEDGYRLPGSRTVAVALEIAARLREAGVGIPLRSGQTANGGINFEWRSGNRTERLTVNARGETELAKFEDSTLVSCTIGRSVDVGRQMRLQQESLCPGSTAKRRTRPV